MENSRSNLVIWHRCQIENSDLQIPARGRLRPSDFSMTPTTSTSFLYWVRALSLGNENFRNARAQD